MDETAQPSGVVFLGQFLQELFDQETRSRKEESIVEKIFHLGVNGGIQPEALVVEANHTFVE